MGAPGGPGRGEREGLQKQEELEGVWLRLALKLLLAAPEADGPHRVAGRMQSVEGLTRAKDQAPRAGGDPPARGLQPRLNPGPSLASGLLAAVQTADSPASVIT